MAKPMLNKISARLVPTLLCSFVALPAFAQGAGTLTDEDADAVPAASAKPAAAGSAAPAPVTPPVAPAPVGEPAPVASYGRSECKHLTADAAGWKVGVCGYVALNAMHDSTQALSAGLNNSIIARPGTYAGDHDQTQFTARDSRINIEASAPATHGVEASGLIQMDFTGIMPADTTEQDSYIFGTPRLRIAVMRLHTPIVDFTAGQYHDLFGWGGSGFFPATLGFLGVPGEIYHRNPQVRLAKTVHTAPVDFEVALAAVRPAQKASGIPDGEAGLRLAVNKWTGAGAQAYNQPSIVPAQVGVSGVARRFRPADFLARPADPSVGYGWGFAANAVIPVIPRSNNEDRSNGLTITAEFSTGSGIADLYTGMTGGLLFPTLPNDQGLMPPPLYVPNIDSGILTFDGNGDLKTANWQAIVLGLQYYLPIAGGRVWISGVYSQSKSNNIVKLTPIPDRGVVYYKSEYEDVSLFTAVTDAVQLSASFQTVRQIFGDRSSARNNRIEFGSHFFF
jgi:hypothetical protein